MREHPLKYPLTNAARFTRLQARKLSAIFFNLAADFGHCLSLAAVMKRYARSPCVATTRWGLKLIHILLSLNICSTSPQRQRRPHLRGHRSDAVRRVGAAGRIGLVYVVLHTAPHESLSATFAHVIPSHGLLPSGMQIKTGEKSSCAPCARRRCACLQTPSPRPGPQRSLCRAQKQRK